jgi:hypothetical protein
LNPNYNEEIAITVIATGFEASYLSSRIGGSQTASALLKELESQSSASDSQATEQPKFTPSTTYKPATEIDEAELEKVDMDLSNKKDEAAKEFQADDGSGATSIWSYDKEEEGKFDKPSFLRKGIFNRNKNQSESGDNSSTEVDK